MISNSSNSSDGREIPGPRPGRGGEPPRGVRTGGGEECDERREDSIDDDGVLRPPVPPVPPVRTENRLPLSPID